MHGTRRCRRSPSCSIPVDGSTNCSRGIPYWGTSLCALDADGPLCALVVNGATGARTPRCAAPARGATASGSTRRSVTDDGPRGGRHRRHAPIRTAVAPVPVARLGRLGALRRRAPAGSTASSTAPTTCTARGTTSGACSCAARAARTSPTHATASSSSPIPRLGASRSPRARPSARRAAGGRRVSATTSTSTTCSRSRSTPPSPPVRSCATASRRRRTCARSIPGDWSATPTSRASARSGPRSTRATPDIPFFGEEEGGERCRRRMARRPARRHRELRARVHAVGVSIGLVEDGEPVVGVVHAPMLGEPVLRLGAAVARSATASASR